MINREYVIDSKIESRHTAGKIQLALSPVEANGLGPNNLTMYVTEEEAAQVKSGDVLVLSLTVKVQ